MYQSTSKTNLQMFLNLNQQNWPLFSIIVIMLSVMSAVGRDATKTASITWLMLSASCFSWWYPWTGDEGALSFCDQKTVESREPALVASWGVQSIGDFLWSEDLPCPFEYFLVCHFVHPGYPHDRTQMSHHEGLQLFHLSSVHCPGLGSI